MWANLIMLFALLYLVTFCFNLEMIIRRKGVKLNLFQRWATSFVQFININTNFQQKQHPNCVLVN